MKQISSNARSCGAATLPAAAVGSVLRTAETLPLANAAGEEIEASWLVRGHGNVTLFWQNIIMNGGFSRASRDCVDLRHARVLSVNGVLGTSANFSIWWIWGWRGRKPRGSKVAYYFLPFRLST